MLPPGWPLAGLFVALLMESAQHMLGCACARRESAWLPLASSSLLGVPHTRGGVHLCHSGSCTASHAVQVVSFQPTMWRISSYILWCARPVDQDSDWLSNRHMLRHQHETGEQWEQVPVPVATLRHGRRALWLFFLTMNTLQRTTFCLGRESNVPCPLSTQAALAPPAMSHHRSAPVCRPHQHCSAAATPVAMPLCIVGGRDPPCVRGPPPA
jgi:hypothetical protein